MFNFLLKSLIFASKEEDKEVTNISFLNKLLEERGGGSLVGRREGVRSCELSSGRAALYYRPSGNSLC